MKKAKAFLPEIITAVLLREVIGDTAAMDKVTDSSLIYELDSRGYNVDNLIEILHKIKS